jgi:hypothetical protein
MSFTQKLLFLSPLVISLLSSCTAVNQARTIGKGRVAVETSLGGPLMTNLGLPLPIPNLYIGGRYGLRDDLDLSTHINVLTPFIPGIGLDLLTSASWVPIQPGLNFQRASKDRGLGAGLGLDIQWITDFNNGFIVMPAFDLSASYRYKWVSVFGGSGVGFDFLRPDKSDNILQVCPFLGLEFITKSQASIGLKFTAFDILYNYNGSQTQWIYLNQNKAERRKHAPLGITIGFGYTFKKKSL